MRVKSWMVFSVMVCIAAGFVLAEVQDANEPQTRQQPAAKAQAETQTRTEAEMQTETQNVQKQAPLRPISRTASPRGEQAFNEHLARRTEEHKASLKELEDIKKLAESEGAVKTAEAIQKLIDKKDAEFKQVMERLNRTRGERRSQLLENTKKEQPKVEPQNDSVLLDKTPKDDSK